MHLETMTSASVHGGRRGAGSTGGENHAGDGRVSFEGPLPTCRCIYVPSNDTLPVATALAGRPTTGQRVMVQFNVEGEGAGWFKGTVTAVNKNKFEVHFDFDGEKVWVDYKDNEWQRDV